MPEGPEIRRSADALGEVLCDRRIKAVELTLPGLQPWANSLTGTTVRQVTCHGKAMLTHFNNGKTLYSHNQLYGVWKITKAGQYPATNRALRVGLHTESHSALLYSATDIEIWETGELQDHPFLKKLGPDVLDTDLKSKQLAARLADTPFRRRSLASLYLDQGFVAGIGNYLRSEILFDAGLSPLITPSKMSTRQINRLASATLKISRRSYKTGGITVTADESRRLKKTGGGFEHYRFAVFNRDGQACIHCGERIQRTDITARRIYWCPTCQPSS